MASRELRRAWTEIVAPEDYDAHMAAIGQAEANAKLVRELINEFPIDPKRHLVFAGAGTGQMFDFVSPDFLQRYQVTFTDIRSQFLDCLRARLSAFSEFKFETRVDDIEEPQIVEMGAAVIVLVLEHVEWRKALDGLIAIGVKRFYLIVQVNPKGMTDAVAPNRVLPGTLAKVPEGAKAELVDPVRLGRFLMSRGFVRHHRAIVSVPDGKWMLGLVYDLAQPR